jgi:hypothetical protein
MFFAKSIMFQHGPECRLRSLLIRFTAWRVLLSLGVRMFSLFPRRRRFTIALHISKLIRPLLQWASLYQPLPHSLDDYPDHVLALILGRMTHYGVEFDPVLTVHGAEALSAGGAIIISGHYYLNFVFLRWLLDQGREVSFVTDYYPERWKIMGTNIPLDAFHASGGGLRGIRRRVKAGGLVAVALDSQHAAQGWRELKMRHRTVFISDTIFRFAERAGLPILFFVTHVTADGRIIAKVARPSSRQAARVQDEFCQFLRHDDEEEAVSRS